MSSPPKVSLRMSDIRTRTEVLYRSRGMKTRQETKRPKASSRTKSLVRRRSWSWVTAIAVS